MKEAAWRQKAGISGRCLWRIEEENREKQIEKIDRRETNRRTWKTIWPDASERFSS